MSFGRRLLPAWLALAVLLQAVPARADEASERARDEFLWNAEGPRYPRVRVAEWIVGGAALAAAISVLLLWRPAEPHWTGPILFDDAIRRALVVDNDADRATLAAVSDVTFYTLMFAPTLVDIGIVTALVHGKTDVAGQMVGMNLLSYGVAGLFAYSVSAAIARQRPFAEPCLDRPDYDPGCGDPGSENASFYSGHAAAAFTGAGVTCAHHTYLPIYGGGLGDAFACGLAVSMATTVAVLRVMTDNHYASDILVGSGIGFALGYGLPYFLHYRHATWAEQLSVIPMLGDGTYGLQIGW